MRKFLSLGLLMALLIGTASAALFESGTKDAQPTVLYGKYNNTIVPVKVSADGSVGGAQAEDSSVIFNVKTEYGAKGDGIYLFDIATTASDNTVTSTTATFTSSDIGKVITITDGTASNSDLTTTIASINSDTSIELTDAPGNTLADAAGCYGTDDTDAINDAIDAIAAQTIPVGEIFFPSGTYIINGAFDQENQSQLGLPTISSVSATPKHHTIIKMSGPIHSKSTNSKRYATGGAVIYSTRNGIAGDSIISGKAVGSSGSLTDVRIEFEKLTFRTVQNPVNSGINVSFLNSVVANDLYVEAGLALLDTKQPTTSTSYGIRTAGELNNSINQWSNIRVQGFYNALDAGEHTNLQNAFLALAVNGLIIRAQTHASYFYDIGIERTINSVVCGGAATFEISLLDLENAGSGSGSWYENVLNISDTASACFGNIVYSITGTEGAGNTLNVSTGAKKISYQSMETGLRMHKMYSTSDAFNIVYTSADGASGGAFLTLRQDDQTAVAAGSRLATINFMGSGNTSGTILNGAEIAVFAEELFTSTKSGSYMRFSTTPISSSTKAERMRITANGNVGIGITDPSGMLVVNPPAAQTIASGNTVLDDSCGTLKLITAAGAVTTDTTNTFTAPAAGNEGCIMHVCNTGANNITLDNNANFKSFGGLDVVMTQDDCVTVGSTGASGVWYQLTALEAN